MSTLFKFSHMLVVLSGFSLIVSAFSGSTCAYAGGAYQPGSKFRSTLNEYGWMATELDPVSSKFVDFSSVQTTPVMDIGTAFGFAALKALDKGAYVIANDIDPRHLKILIDTVSDEQKKRLVLNSQRFPDSLNLPESSVSAVLASRVFHFLTGEELELGVKKLRYWLIPGGKVFVLANSPYRKNLSDYLELYLVFKSLFRYPGLIHDLSAVNFGQSQNLPKMFHFLDVEILSRLFEEAGFDIEMAEYVQVNGIPKEALLDGRENVGIIAVKPAREVNLQTVPIQSKL